MEGLPYRIQDIIFMGTQVRNQWMRMISRCTNNSWLQIINSN